MKHTLTLLTPLLLAPLAALHGANTTPGLASEQPQVQANCDGVPIKRFGFCWVLGEAPNLLDDRVLSEAELQALHQYLRVPRTP